MQKRLYKPLKHWKARVLTILCFLLLLSVVPRTVHTHEVYAHTAARRSSLQLSDIVISRDRVLRSAKAHIERANEVGYGYNNILRGTDYRPLTTSTRKFCCVDLVTHVLYTATASMINGRYHSIADTLATRHAYANSNGIVFDTSGVGILRRQLIAMPQLYTRHVAPVDKSQLRFGDIVISGDREAMSTPDAPAGSSHVTLVIGKVTPAENAYLQIPNYNANVSYFITMDSSRGARWVNTNWYNRDWNTGDPNKGYFISNMFRPRFQPAQQDYGGFRIRKTDADTGAGLAGAEFDLRDPKGDIKKIVMTSSEYSTGLEYEPGRYILTETKAPEGYTLDPTPRTIDIEMDEINSVYWDSPITNAPSDGFVQVMKKDARTGERIAGAVFDFAQSPSFPEESTVQLTTRADGTTVPQEFTIGDGATVYVREVSVPAPYLLDTSVREVTLGASETVNVTFENGRAEGRVELFKRGGENVPIEGAVFEVRNTADSVVATLTTNASGKAQTELLPLGDYSVTEISVPPPYVLDSTPIPVSLTYKDMNTPIVVEERTIGNDTSTGQIKISKRDAINERVLSGAIFEIRDGDGAVVDTITTNASGEGVSTRLPLGGYTVKEITPPDGYLANETAYEVVLTHKDMYTSVVEEEIQVENEPIRGKICIIKMAKGDEAPIEGATFELFNRDDTPAVDVYGKPVGTLTTDQDGLAFTPYLRVGTYILRETNAPEAFYINNKDFEAVIVRHNEVVDLRVQNERILPRLRVTKIDSTNHKRLQGAEFQLYDAKGRLVTFEELIDGRSVAVDRLITNDKGIAISGGPLAAGTYTLRELKAPDGYVSAEEITFEITRDTTLNDLPRVGKVLDITVGNVPTVIEISKKKITGDEELPGANLQIIEKESGTVVAEWTSTDSPHIVRRLNVGMTYILRETISPDGYTVATDIDFVVLNTGEVQRVEMRNKLTHVKIHKRDKLTGRALEGVEFLIQDKDETKQRFVYDEALKAYVWEDVERAGKSSVLTTDVDGTILLYGLPIGDYKLVETKTPSGYKRLSGCSPFTVNDTSDDTTPVVIALENEKNEITLKKTDLATGAPVAGAVIQIFNESGNKVYEVTTDAAGQSHIQGLNVGTYTFREILAPDGYILNEETFTFTIDVYGEVNGVTSFTNDPTSLAIVKEDSEQGKRLEGAVFELYRLSDRAEPELMRFRQEDGLYIADATGDFAELVSDSEGTIAVLQLPYGDYRLAEIEAPKGYNLPESAIDVTLRDDGETLTVTILNKVTPSPTPLVKTGEAFPFYAFPLLGIAVVLLLIVLFLRRKRNNTEWND